jgi:hypothetical protein
MFKALLIIGGLFAGTYGLFRFTGGAASLKQASDNLIYKFKISKWTINSGNLNLAIDCTIINPDLNESFKLLYPQLLLIDSSSYPFEASVIYDETLKDKEYTLEPRGQLIFDTFIIHISLKSLLSIFMKVAKANLSSYSAAVLQITKAILLKDISQIDTVYLNSLIEPTLTEIKKNIKGRIITRLNGIQVSYDFDLV